VVDAGVGEGPDQAGDVGGLAGERPRLGGWLTQPERGGPLVKHVAMNMHHYWKFRDGKICYVRSSEDTAQVAAALTP
jgi:hypothetical protein